MFFSYSPPRERLLRENGHLSHHPGVLAVTIELNTLLTILGMAGGGVLLWIGLIRRVDTKVSHKELQDNLERRDTRVQNDIHQVLEELSKQNEISAQYRKLTADQLQKLSEDMAVLKDRAGRARSR